MYCVLTGGPAGIICVLCVDRTSWDYVYWQDQMGLCVCCVLTGGPAGIICVLCVGRRTSWDYLCIVC